MSELNYKASNIARAERTYGMKFLSELSKLEGLTGNAQAAVDKLGFDTIIFLMVAGGSTEDETDRLIDEDGLLKPFELIGEALKTSGFLAKLKDNPEVKAQLAKLQQEASPTTGENKKTSLSKSESTSLSSGNSTSDNSVEQSTATASV